jgi:hypothetical protein
LYVGIYSLISLSYSDSEDEHGGDDGTTDIDPQKQCVNVPDDPAPHSPHPSMNLQSEVKVEITPFPSKTAGTPVTNGTHQQAHYEAYRARMGNADNVYAPFCSKVDWEIARWAKTHGPSSVAVSELLGIDGVCFLIHALYYIYLSCAS